jgi:hypothetical protein
MTDDAPMTMTVLPRQYVWRCPHSDAGG